MSSDADGRLVKTGMIVHLEGEFHVMAALQQLETTGGRQLTVGKMERAVGMMSTSEVGDGLERLLYTECKSQLS